VKFTVMLVDDDPALRDLLRQMLELGGYTVHEAEDGLDALDKLEEMIPDAMILDVMMPNMDGISLLKVLRQQADTADLPVIIVSGKTQKKAIKDGMQAGANEYMCKPIAYEELLLNIRRFLPKPSAVL
jgi:adenylate cyclase